ncbi:MAG TPA: YhjD/YihY/BrkB family envelope integrity protein, partial [Kiloniellales bacterium]|nr:YhjD/YihY/BrkB family envelope integrity protein [Kiloniellales bacterium]
ILIGASITISSYAFAAAEWFDLEGMSRGLVETSRLLSLTFGALGFSLLYFVVPNRAVGISHALAGGVVAALLFELLKSGFGLYLKHFPSYQLVYGALSTLPIFLVWMYLSWAVALFGAEVAAALPEWRATRARGSRAAGPGAHLALALSLLARLRAASVDGTRPRERRLARGLPATPAEVDTVLRRLRRARFVDRTLGGRWVLSRDLRHARLRELVAVLKLEPGPGAGWPPQAQNAVAGLAARLADSLDRPIEALLDEAAESSAAEPGRHDPAKS